VNTPTLSMKPISCLILADLPNWIVCRITDEMIRRMPCDFTKRYYTQISTDEFVTLANQHDLVHYQNSDWQYHIDRIDEIKVPIITSIRSFRYPDYIHRLDGKVHYHILNPLQREFFPDATYIPDGVFPFESRPFTVGFAGRPDEYKGYEMIERACRELGVIFKPALNLRPNQMQEYYDSIDLYVCASENEGHSTPVMECLSMNKPVITTDVGIPHFLNVYKIKRTVEGIKDGISIFYTKPMVRDFSWESACNKFTELYETIARRRSTEN
jgi:glycosyltransferase involved in cell wall biosynthesis